MSYCMMTGRLTLATYDTAGRLTRRQMASNIVTASGISDVVAAISYAGVQDVADLIGATAFTFTPLYGAVGIGTNPPFTTTGQVTAGSQTITNVGSTTNLLTGYVVQGAGIPPGASIVSTTSNTITLTDYCTATSSGNTSLTIGTTSVDTQLYSELSRATASGNASGPTTGNTSAFALWQFQFSAQADTYSVTEAGVFCVASLAANTGDMLDHAVFSPAFTWAAGDSLTLAAQIGFGAPT